MKTPQKPARSKLTGIITFSVDMLLGGVAAAISKTICAPIERVKLILQAQRQLKKVPKGKTIYTGITDCIVKITKFEGIRHL